MLSQMKLHNYYRSSASFRVRIALELKRLEAFERLMPQLFNAARFNLNVNGRPRTLAIYDVCMALPAFQRAQPSACPDSPP